MGVCVANPITLRALELGHPEELLGAALCVASVLLAERDHPLLAGLALGGAIANKEWALLAVGPVLLTLPSRRVLCLLACGSLAAVVLRPAVARRLGRLRREHARRGLASNHDLSALAGVVVPRSSRPCRAGAIR